MKEKIKMKIKYCKLEKCKIKTKEGYCKEERISNMPVPIRRNQKKIKEFLTRGIIRHSNST